MDTVDGRESDVVQFDPQSMQHDYLHYLQGDGQHSVDFGRDLPSGSNGIGNHVRRRTNLAASRKPDGGLDSTVSRKRN